MEENDEYDSQTPQGLQPKGFFHNEEATRNWLKSLYFIKSSESFGHESRDTTFYWKCCLNTCKEHRKESGNKEESCQESHRKSKLGTRNPRPLKQFARNDTVIFSTA
jgi:hypothetical protein